MPVERQTWIPQTAWAGANALLRRVVEVFDVSDRHVLLTANATATIALTYPKTLLESDTTAGAVTITFPSAATVPGFEVTAVKTAGANVLTVSGTVVATAKRFISNGAAWRAM